MIELADVHFHYPRSTFALHIPRLSIADGEKVALVGPSGSGKTTLLNLLSGILLPDRGSLHMGAFAVTEMDDRRRRNFRISHIGLIFQRFDLIEYLNVRDNILLPYLINKSLKFSRATVERVEAIAEELDLADKLERHPQRLSQGEQQRVAIGRAILVQPTWVLADEPTGSLDPANKHRSIELLFRQSEERQSTLLVVTHDSGILEGFDRVIDFAEFHSTKPLGGAAP